MCIDVNFSTSVAVDFNNQAPDFLNKIAKNSWIVSQINQIAAHGDKHDPAPIEMRDLNVTHKPPIRLNLKFLFS